MKMRLAQELFAEELWLRWQYRPMPPSQDEVMELLHKHNLKLKKGFTKTDAGLIIGRALKGCCTHGSKVQADLIADETDRICTIERWDFAVELHYRK